MDLAEMQRRIDAVEWYHEFDFPNGLKARSKHDVEGHRLIWKFISSQLDTVDFHGKTVLDIGCWDGYWSFDAERRGAKSVLASDDVSQNWMAGQGLRLARELLASRVEVDQGLSIYDLGRLNRQFDIILCLGVYYHLLDPYYAFAQVRHCCHPGTIVLIEGDGALGGLEPNTLMFDLSDLGKSIFIPTKQTLAHMCQASYINVTSQTWLTENYPPPAHPPAVHEKPDRLGCRWRRDAAVRALAGSRAGLLERVQHMTQPTARPEQTKRLRV